MSAPANEQLRAYATSVGFALTLSKSQIELLVLLDRFTSYDGMCRAGEHVSTFVMTFRALEARGLAHGGRGTGNPIRLTKAGELTCDLLAEAGIYSDVLDRKGIEAQP